MEMPTPLDIWLNSITSVDSLYFKEISGEYANAVFKKFNYQICKTVSQSLKHRDLIFKNNETIDNIKHYKLGSVHDNNTDLIYSTFYHTINQWFYYYSGNNDNDSLKYYVFDVEFPKNSIVIIYDEKKIGSTSITLTNQRKISDLPDWKNRSWVLETVHYAANSACLLPSYLYENSHLLMVLNESVEWSAKNEIQMDLLLHLP